MAHQIIPITDRKTSPLMSLAVRAGGFVFLSGQGSVNEQGQIVPDTLEGEMRRTFDNVKAVLAAAGLDLSHVVRVTSYVRDPEDVPEYNRIYAEYFPRNPPARTTIVKCLAPIKYEVDIIAYDGN